MVLLEEIEMPKLSLMFDNKIVKEVPVGSRPVTIGRSPDNDIPVDNLAVSNHHAKVFFEAGRMVVEDLDSLNGTFVNDLRVERATLHDGDNIHIGKHKIKVDASGASPLASTLILCLPMWMLSPSCKVARSTRRSFTKVPFRLSRSSTTIRPASKKTFAWWLDTARLSTGMSLSGERPMVTLRLPTRPSFTILLSNMRLSFGISISSSSTI